MDRLKRNAYMREWNRKNPQNKKERDRLYYQKNRAKILERVSEYNEKNREAKLKYLREYGQRNKERRNEYCRRRKREIPEVKIAELLRGRMKSAMKKSLTGGTAIRNLGCTIPELKLHLEAQFKEGMTWQNHGLHGWHIDHIRPLCSFDLTNKEQVSIALNYKNLQPLWAKENLKKRRKYIL